MNKLAQLETELAALGRFELMLENTLRDLKQAARQAVASGRDQEADMLWGKVDEVQDRLTALGKTVRTIEVQLYGARRRLRL